MELDVNVNLSLVHGDGDGEEEDDDDAGTICSICQGLCMMIVHAQCSILGGSIFSLFGTALRKSYLLLILAMPQRLEINLHFGVTLLLEAETRM